MAKRSRETDSERIPYQPKGSPPSRGNQGPLVLAGVAILLVLGGFSLAEVKGLRKELGEKVALLENKIADLQRKVEAAPKAQAPQRGPDPNRVYTVKTDGAPTKGNPAAPVTIAEFSDFQ